MAEVEVKRQKRRLRARKGFWGKVGSIVVGGGVG